MRSRVTRRLMLLETSQEAAQRATGGARWPTVAQWRQFYAGDVDGVPDWAIEALTERRQRGEDYLSRVMEDIADG